MANSSCKTTKTKFCRIIMLLLGLIISYGILFISIWRIKRVLSKRFYLFQLLIVVTLLVLIILDFVYFQYLALTIIALNLVQTYLFFLIFLLCKKTKIFCDYLNRH